MHIYIAQLMSERGLSSILLALIPAVSIGATYAFVAARAKVVDVWSRLNSSRTRTGRSQAPQVRPRKTMETASNFLTNSGSLSLFAEALLNKLYTLHKVLVSPGARPSCLGAYPYILQHFQSASCTLKASFLTDDDTLSKIKKRLDYKRFNEAISKPRAVNLSGKNMHEKTLESCPCGRKLTSFLIDLFSKSPDDLVYLRTKASQVLYELRPHYEVLCLVKQFVGSAGELLSHSAESIHQNIPQEPPSHGEEYLQGVDALSSSFLSLLSNYVRVHLMVCRVDAMDRMMILVLYAIAVQYESDISAASLQKELERVCGSAASAQAPNHYGVSFIL